MPEYQWLPIQEIDGADAAPSRQHRSKHLFRKHSKITLILFSFAIQLLLQVDVCFGQETTTSETTMPVTTTTPAPPPQPMLYAIRCNSYEFITGLDSGAVLQVAPEQDLKFTLFADNLADVLQLWFVDSQNCSSHHGRVDITTFKGEKNRIDFEAMLPKNDVTYKLCGIYKYRTTINGQSQLSEETLNIELPNSERVLIHTEYKAREYKLHFLWLQIVILGVLLILSGLFSGLNLGLMSLDPSELALIIKSGTKAERRYANTILPIRKSGNYLLCTLLLGNVVVNCAISILMDDIATGLIALVASSLGIVIFGEIVPQSICNRKGLAVGAYTIWITRFFMILTFPLSYPISKVLDIVLGEEAGVVYSKDRLLELIRMQAQTQPNQADEFRIVSGALEYTLKTVTDVMTKAENVFMLHVDAVLNSKKIAEIINTGYTRIPVYENDRNHIVSLLNVKDFALLDPDDNFTVRTLCSYYEHPVRFVMEDTPLKVMLEEFRKGHYHMAMVQRIIDPEEGDPYFELSGIVTLEDIIEEIIQAEINDETDVITDNVNRKKRKAQIVGISRFLANPNDQKANMTPQLQLAAVQYMSAHLAPFDAEFISLAVLQRLVVNSCRRWQAPSPSIEEQVPPRTLYKKGVSDNKFILMLEGRVQVTIGQSGQTYETGPFFHFGLEVLEKMKDLLPAIESGNVGQLEKAIQSNAASPLSTGTHATTAHWQLLAQFTPDYTAIANMDIVYIEVSAVDYLRAYRTSRIDTAQAKEQRGQPGVDANRQLLNVSDEAVDPAFLNQHATTYRSMVSAMPTSAQSSAREDTLQANGTEDANENHKLTQRTEQSTTQS